MLPLLIDAASLHTCLAAPKTAIRVVDCRSKLQQPGWGREQYLAGHIPGAVHADLEHDLSGPIIAGQTGRHPLPTPAALARTLSGFGIGPETTVIAYDDAGGAYASRLWWLLRWLGHDRCQLLDGGMPAWQAAGYALTAGAESASPAVFIGDLQPAMTVAAEQLLPPSTTRVLVDVRGAARYAGAEEPIDPVAGHIPGAINLPFTGNLGLDNRFLPTETLRQRYVAAGAADAETVFYCGSGVTACHGIFAMALAGLPSAKLYPGSWSEWITQPDRPIACGEQP